MRVSNVRAIMERPRGQGSADAFWLARKEMRKAWPAFMLGASIVSVLGLFAAVSLYGVLKSDGSGAGDRMGQFYDAFFTDFLFLLVLAVLGANTLLLKYYTLNWRDSFSSRLPFLSRLPISAGALVGGRALCMLSTLALSALAFFLPVYHFSGLGEQLGAGTYLAFCGLWIGYSLLGAGLWLLLEFGVGGGAYTIISYAFAIALMVVVLVLDWTAEVELVAKTTQLAQGGYGVLSSIFSILAGGAAFLLLAWATVRHVQKDEPVQEPLRASVGA